MCLVAKRLEVKSEYILEFESNKESNKNEGKPKQSINSRSSPYYSYLFVDLNEK